MKNHVPPLQLIRQQREQLVTRRQVLVSAAGGTLALLFGPPEASGAKAGEDEWVVIDRVQQHLFPDEPDAPGATAINALAYLRQVLQDPGIPAEDRAFVLKGVSWLQGMAQQQHQSSFLALSDTQQAALLQLIARSEAGENWLSTLLTYIFEALLTAPAYGGNPGGVGWKWLKYIPGFPLPDEHTLHTRLPR